MLETFTQAVRIAHLDTDYRRWVRAVTSTPASIMGLKDQAILAAGKSADMILFRARSMSELLSRPQSDRVVLRRGRPLAQSVPDYRELDDLLLSA
jgi:cytosine deaminase